MTMCDNCTTVHTKGLGPYLLRVSSQRSICSDHLLNILNMTQNYVTLYLTGLKQNPSSAFLRDGSEERGSLPVK